MDGPATVLHQTCRWESRRGAGGAQDSSGVRQAARSEGLEGNWRDPTLRPTSGEGGACEPEVVKGRRAGRDHMRKTIGKPCAGNPHAWFERGIQETGLQGHPA